MQLIIDFFRRFYLLNSSIPVKYFSSRICGDKLLNIFSRGLSSLLTATSVSKKVATRRLVLRQRSPEFTSLSDGYHQECGNTSTAGVFPNFGSGLVCHTIYTFLASLHCMHIKKGFANLLSLAYLVIGPIYHLSRAHTPHDRLSACTANSVEPHRQVRLIRDVQH